MWMAVSRWDVGGWQGVGGKVSKKNVNFIKD